ncbi:hypothetical protein QN379_23220, partial [Glaciimonas sp. Gout2]|nr:hypothetical protein [Glaciimonas sp. Gout2]
MVHTQNGFCKGLWQRRQCPEVGKAKAVLGFVKCQSVRSVLTQTRPGKACRRRQHASAARKAQRILGEVKTVAKSANGPDANASQQGVPT